MTGLRFGGGHHAVDVKVAQLGKSGRSTKNAVTLYTGNTYFLYPTLRWPGTFRPFDDYDSHIDIIAVYRLDTESRHRVCELELIVHEAWRIASRNRSSSSATCPRGRRVGWHRPGIGRARGRHPAGTPGGARAWPLGRGANQRSPIQRKQWRNRSVNHWSVGRRLSLQSAFEREAGVLGVAEDWPCHASPGDAAHCGGRDERRLAVTPTPLRREPVVGGRDAPLSSGSASSGPRDLSPSQAGPSVRSGGGPVSRKRGRMPRVAVSMP